MNLVHSVQWALTLFLLSLFFWRTNNTWVKADDCHISSKWLGCDLWSKRWLAKCCRCCLLCGICVCVCVCEEGVEGMVGGFCLCWCLFHWSECTDYLTLYLHVCVLSWAFGCMWSLETHYQSSLSDWAAREQLALTVRLAGVASLNIKTMGSRTAVKALEKKMPIYSFFYYIILFCRECM